MTLDEQLASAAGEPAGVVPARGPRSSRTCTFPARPPRSSCTATPTICFASIGPRRCGARRYGVLAEFLAEQLFGRWSLVLHYDLGRGLRAFAGRDEQRLKDMVALANRKVGDLSALPKDPAATFALLDRFVRNNIMAAEEDRLSLALIMDQASYVFPSGEPGRLNLQASSQLVTMLNWAMSPHVKRLEHGVRDGRREARGPQRSAHRQSARRDHRGAPAGREGPARRSSACPQEPRR